MGHSYYNAGNYPKKSTGWAELNGANAVSLVVVKHVLENVDNFWHLNYSSFTHFEKHKN